MQPESLPCDRKDSRKNERYGLDPRLGVGGFGRPHKWREQQRRWSSDFRSPRLLPPGQGKQGGYHMYPDDASCEFLPLACRHADRNLEDENSRPVVSRGNGRCFRNNWENTGSITQRDWKAPAMKPAASPSDPGKSAEFNNLRSIENTQPCHRSSYASAYTSDHSQSIVKEKNTKNGATADEPASQESEKENQLGLIDWKPMKRARLGSLSSGGGSSKSVGPDSTEIVAEGQQKNSTLIQSPSAEAASTPDKNDLRKKPNLGWGEGLAKYEKKKIRGPEDGAAKNELVVPVINTETLQSQSVNLPEKSPRVSSLSDGASPGTPSSVACSSSLGAKEKEFVKEANMDCKLSCAPSNSSQPHYGHPVYNLENLELASIANLSSLINELLQPNDPTSAETGYVRTTSMNKLLGWKVEVSKALEMTESEIESLETELKSLIAEPGFCCPHPAGSSLLPADQHLKPHEGLVTTSECSIRAALLQIVLSGETIAENAPTGLEDVHILSKDEDIYSPGSATSKFVELLPATLPSETEEFIEGSMNQDLSDSSNLAEKYITDNHVFIGITSREDLVGVRNMHCDVDNMYDSILLSNRDAASRSLEQFNQLFPKHCRFDTSIEPSISSSQRASSVVKEKFLKRKRFLRFKEKVLTLKFKVLQHFWMEGRLLSLRKLRMKTQKKFDPSRNVHKSNHSSIHSRVSSYAGGPQTVPADEVIEFVNRLLQELAFKPYRNTLKMPALIMDNEVKMPRFISNNGLVEDPCAVEKERSIINAWTSKEKEIFIDKLAAFGKDFRKVASFLDHKTVADCIEFYYMNHKSKCFEKTRKNPGFTKLRKSPSRTYLVASGKRWNRELNAASLDILGAASEILANMDDGIYIQQKCPSKFSSGAWSSRGSPTGDDRLLQGSNTTDTYSNERETGAADVLAGICGSLLSEAMSSCITNSVDLGDCYQNRRCPEIGSAINRPLTPEVNQDVDDECSDESCVETNPTDWSDEEKSIFVQAVSSYGMDFVTISRCIRTRSMDQCKVFFSKARKCLGLDLIQPAAEIAFGDVNGGRSDIEDSSTLENGSIISNDGSECKMEEDPSPSDMKLNCESDMVGALNLRPDFEITEGNNGLGPLYPVPTEMVSVCSDGDDNPDADINVHSGRQITADGAYVSVQELQTVVVSSEMESEREIEEVDDLCMPNVLSEAEKVEVSDVHSRQENQWRGPLLPEENSENKIIEDGDANFSEVISGLREMKTEPQLTGNVSHPSVDAHSTTLVDQMTGYQKKADFGTCSNEQSFMSSLHQNGNLASVMSSTRVSVPIKYEITPNHDALSVVGANTISGMHSHKVVWMGGCQEHLPGYSFSNSMESSQILQGYPVSVQAMKEINGDVNCGKPTALLIVNNQEGNLSSDRHTDFFLQKCNGPRQQGKVVEAPFASSEQSRDHSSAVDKPSRNGDVKLFGKILVSSQQKPSNCIERADDNSSQDRKIGHESLNLKLGADEVNFNPVQPKFDGNNYVGIEYIPFRSFGPWDGNMLQTGIPPPLPDSTLLLTKYPAIYSNCAKWEQPPLHGMFTTSNCPGNGASILSARELSSSDRLADYQGLQPFTMDTKQPQDVVFAEMQRRNGFNVLSGMQRGGMSGDNSFGRGGAFVGGQCFSSVSDPVAAIKMHYAKAEQLSVQGGNVIKEDDRWISNSGEGRWL